MARTGEYALAMGHRGKPLGKDSSNEKRFRVPPLAEVWWSYWLRVPENFEHRIDRPNNNKFGCVWDVSYEREGVTVCWEYVRRRERCSQITYRWVSDGRRRPHDGHANLFCPEDRGKWGHFVHHIHPEQGSIQLWRKWEDEDRYTNLHDVRKAPIKDMGPISFGYWQGWSNSGFTEDTIFYGDDFRWANTPPEGFAEP